MDPVNIAVSSIANFGYFAVFFLLVLGSCGLPLPEEPILLLVGYLISVDFFDANIALAVALLGTLIGDNISYWVARNKGLAFIMKYEGLFFIKKTHLLKAEKFFDVHGGKAVFFARFLIGLRFFGPILAGVSKMKWSRFQTYDFLGAVFWIPLMMGVGYIFGTNISAILKDVEKIAHFVFGAVLIITSAFIIKRLIEDEVD